MEAFLSPDNIFLSCAVHANATAEYIVITYSDALYWYINSHIS